jgi:PAS domain S-box-containing protein
MKVPHMPNLTRSRLQRYGFAVLAVAIALLLKLLLNPLLEVESPFLLFFATVMLSAWYGGMKPGIVAAVLSALGSDYFFLSPTYSFLKGSLGQNVRLGLFVLEGLSISWLIAQLHAAKQTGELNQRRLQESETQVRQLVDSKREALQKLTFHVENTPLAVVEWDRDYRVSRWSPQAEAIFGWKPEEVLGKQPNDWEFVYPEDLEEVKAVIERLVDGCEQRNMVRNRNYTKDGSIVHCEWYSSALLDESGNFESVLCLVLDVTERQQLAEALQQKAIEQEALLNSIPALVYYKDRHSNYITVNQTFAEITNIPIAEIPGKTDFDLFPHDEAVAFRQDDQAVIASGQPKLNIEEPVTGADGNTLWTATYKTPYRDRRGEITGLVGITIDITDRKRAEEQIRVHAARLQVLAEAARRFSEAILDFQAVLDEVIQRIAQLLGDACVIRLLSEDEQWLELVAVYHPNPEAIALLREILSASPQRIDEGLTSRVMQTGQPLLIPVVSQEELHASAKQEYLRYLDSFDVNSILIVPLRVRGRVIGVLHLSRDRPGCPYAVDDLVFLQDLAERAALAIDNARLYSQALEANRLKDDFLAIVSHELRTPINAVLGWATLLRTRKFNEGKKAQALEIIERNAKLQTQLIEDLLDISRLIQGKLRLNLRPLDIIPVLEATIKAVLPTAESKAIQIVSVFDPTVGQVCADSNRLQQVISNLLSNAIKFTPVGGRVEVRLSVVSDRQQKTDNGQWTTQNYAQIEVSDTGKGISPDFLPYVFDRFRQAESAITRSNSGMGLGLAIVHQLVELHDGTVYADSPGIGQGATFTVKLPLWESVTREEILGQSILA